jgi:hypothetical protein
MLEMFKAQYKEYDCHKWRKDYYWCQLCDNVIKDNLKLIKDIFNTWTQYLPSEERHLQLKDFSALINKSDVLHDTFGAKDIGPLFNLSM